MPDPAQSDSVADQSELRHRVEKMFTSGALDEVAATYYLRLAIDRLACVIGGAEALRMLESVVDQIVCEIEAGGSVH